jgi:hypothetical protein
MLNEKYQYMFLLRNNKENRLVCEGTSDDENSIFHVGTMHNLNFVEHDLGLKVPERFEFKSIDELNDFVYNKVDHTKTQGIFCYNKTKNVQLKILHPEYFKLYQIRGNQSSLKFRYLQLRNDEEKLKSFLELYSDKKQDFQEYENIISHITQTLFDTYFAKYINKKYIRLNSRDYNILKECHNWHVQDRKNNRISLAKVSQVLNEQTPTCINHMIKRYKKELYDTQKENYETPVQLE